MRWLAAVEAAPDGDNPRRLGSRSSVVDRIALPTPWLAVRRDGTTRGYGEGSSLVAPPVILRPKSVGLILSTAI